MRFYNPSNRIQEKLAYNNRNDIKEMNNISYYSLDAPEKDFFDVPTMITIHDQLGQEFDISTPFPAEVKRLYAHRGVVMINPKHKGEIGETENVARTDEEAKEKAIEMYQQHLHDTVREWYGIVDRARANNARPNPATGQFKHALKVLNLQDPADEVTNVLSANAGKGDDAATQARLAEQDKLINELKGSLAVLLSQQNRSEPTTKTNGK
jgi:hypothetical protein